MLLAPSAALAVRGLPEKEAKHYMKKALKQDDELGFRWAYGKDFSGCKHVNKSRVRCKVEWFLGDIDYKGRVTVWLRQFRGELWWYYAYDIKGINRYCQDVGGKNCIRHWHVD